MEMSLKEKFQYFLERQDVKEQLHRGAMRASVIPLQSRGEHTEQKNLLIVRVKDDQTGGASVGKSLRICRFGEYLGYSPRAKRGCWIISLRRVLVPGGGECINRRNASRGSEESFRSVRSRRRFLMMSWGASKYRSSGIRPSH